jgi:translation initiation factor IF-2
MSEANENDGDKTDPVRPHRIELKKRVDVGQVRQSFSHGRSRAVSVEVKKRRTIGKPGAAAAESATAASAAARALIKPEVKAAQAAKPAQPTEAENAAAKRSTRSGVVLQQLTEEEKAGRVKALGDSRKVAAAARERAEIDAKRRAEDEQAAQIEHAAAERRAAEEEARKKTDDDARRRGEAEAARRLAVEKGQAEAAGLGPAVEAGDDEAKARRGSKAVPARAPSAPKPEARRRSGKITLSQALSEEERVRSLASFRRAREREKRQTMRGKSQDAPKKVLRDVVIPEAISVQELANRMAERSVDVIRSLMKMGVMATVNQVIDSDTAELIVAEFGHRAKRVAESDIEIGIGGIVGDDDANLLPRAPVVTVMGHVDHGKTSLLDALRSTDVASHEAGGITQHIGAYQVSLKDGKRITFLDTPGHEAFTAMRSRGAKATDIVVLVVAADDGIMPQTIEAIHHAKAANVPMVVAINKCDKPDAQPDRVRRDLLQHEVVVEQLGGDVQAVEVSAKSRANLDKLEEAILLQAEILDLKANPDRMAEGVVIEAKVDRGRGPVATVLVQRGTIRLGDVLVAGSEWGRVKALIDDHGQNVTVAGPSTPVEILGLQGTPEAGDGFSVVENETRARDVADFRTRKSRDRLLAAGGRGTIEQMFVKIKAGEVKGLPVLVKTDVQGSLEAIVGALQKLGTEEVSVRVLHSAVGGINESDVTLARASGAMIVGFNVRANKQARDLATRDGVDIRYYSIIYNVIDDMKAMLGGMLAPQMRERFLGYAEIREVFAISKVGKVAGCMVTEGTVKRGAKVRLLRDNVVIHEGALSTLKRFKDDAREVKQGTECGMSFENYNDLQKGDMIECFEVEQIARTL